MSKIARELTQATRDIRTLVSMLEGLMEATSEALDVEDMLLLDEIKSTHLDQSQKATG